MFLGDITNMKRSVFVLFLFFLWTTGVSAQWRVGAYGGIDWSKRSINPGYSYSLARTERAGGVAGITSQYAFKEWLSVRMDLNAQWRKYTDKYSVLEIEYRYDNMYLTLPVMASFSFGGDMLRGYADGGAYVGLWCTQCIDSRQRSMTEYDSTDHPGHGYAEYSESGFSKADRRFDAGIVGCMGISYKIMASLEINIECMLYYGLTDSHNTGSSKFVQPSYYTIPCINMGVAWVLDNKSK